MDLRDAKGQSILHWGAFHSNGEVLKLLIEKGFFVNAQDDKQYTPLMMAAKSLNSNKVEILIKFGGANIHLENRIGHKALQVAIAASQNAVYERTIKHEYDLEDHEDQAFIFKLLQ